jgi:hypothetical protein
MEVVQVTLFAVGEMAMKKHFKKSSPQQFFQKFLVVEVASYRTDCSSIITNCKTFLKMQLGNYLHYYLLPPAIFSLHPVIKQLYILAPLPCC